ncbi:hypothetical protein [Bacillus sp. B1-b2]|uniref:hypothetical protein n=1 Tax=Bacillus sp. B1-b2 TaxID=2653201 RepID=UPI00126241FC|nr:hypothetical protein [Bacillus sp. B1-b2]KAB7673139.1 hypothetical protein F9279_01630 [Bacillus sp. B1-b2]
MKLKGQLLALIFRRAEGNEQSLEPTDEVAENRIQINQQDISNITNAIEIVKNLVGNNKEA